MASQVFELDGLSLGQVTDFLGVYPGLLSDVQVVKVGSELQRLRRCWVNRVVVTKPLPALVQAAVEPVAVCCSRAAWKVKRIGELPNGPLGPADGQDGCMLGGVVSDEQVILMGPGGSWFYELVPEAGRCVDGWLTSGELLHVF